MSVLFSILPKVSNPESGHENKCSHAIHTYVPRPIYFLVSKQRVATPISGTQQLATPKCSLVAPNRVLVPSLLGPRGGNANRYLPIQNVTPTTPEPEVPPRAQLPTLQPTG